jgi:serine-threonine kinase receptor-associated protein
MVRDGRSGDWIGTFVGHKGAVWSTRLDPQGYLAATASGDFSVRVWDAITGEGLWLLNHKHIVKSVDFSHDSKRLATGGHEGLLRIYDLLSPAFGLTTAAAKNKGTSNSNNKKETAVPPSEVKVEEPLLAIPQSPDKKITISKCLWYDNSTVIAAGDDGCVRLWYIPTTTAPLKMSDDDNATPPEIPTPVHHLLRTIPVEAGVGIRDMELSFVPPPVGNSISGAGTAPIPVLTVAAGDHVYFYNLADNLNDTPLKKWKMPIHFRNEGGASLHPSGKYFIAGGSDLWVRVFDYETGNELECNKGHHGPIRCLRYAPDGNTYATGSEDGTIRLWKTFS